MAGEDKVMSYTGAVPSFSTIEDNLHSYTNDTSAVAVGDIVYQDTITDDKVLIADADTASTNPPIGMVVSVTDTTNCVVCHMGGIATGLTGPLTKGSKYWLSTTGTSGNTITITEPSSNAYFVGVALSSTSILLGVTPFDTAGSGGGISGTGTSTYLARWSDSTTLDNGSITDDGAGSIGFSVASPNFSATGITTLKSDDIHIDNLSDLNYVEFNGGTGRVTFDPSAVGGAVALDCSSGRIQLANDEVISWGGTGVGPRIDGDDTTDTLRLIAPSVTTAEIQLLIGSATNMLEFTRPSSGNIKLAGSQALEIESSGDLTLDAATASNFIFQVAGSTIATLDAAGEFSLNSGHIRALLDIQDKTTSYTISSTDDIGTIFTNNGATSTVTFSLPAASVGLHYEFVVRALFTLKISPNGTDVIRLGAISQNNSIESTATGDTVRLVCMDSSTWVQISGVGTWSHSI